MSNMNWFDVNRMIDGISLVDIAAADPVAMVFCEAYAMTQGLAAVLKRYQTDTSPPTYKVPRQLAGAPEAFLDPNEVASYHAKIDAARTKLSEAYILLNDIVKQMVPSPASAL